MTTGLNIVLLALGALQSIFLFLLLFKKRNILPGYSFLAAYLLVLILQITFKLASKVWLMQHVGLLYTFSYQLPFLYGPLAWLFVRQITGLQRVNKKDIAHFIPAALVMTAFILSDIFNSLAIPVWLLFNRAVTMALQLLSIIVYHFLAFNLWKQFSNKVQATGSLHNYLMVWLRQFVIASGISSGIVAVTICLMYYNHPQWQDVRFGFVILTGLVYWVSYKSWNQPELSPTIQSSSTENRIPALKVHLPQKKYANSGMDPAESLRIIAALENKMMHERLFLNADLTIDDLAASVDCSRHHLSQVINEQLHQSFYDCINGYRVEEASRLLTDLSKSSYKIASVAYDAGFNSISTFNDVFKKHTGFTPSQFRKQKGIKSLQQQRV